MHCGCRTVVLAAVLSKQVFNLSLTPLSRLASSMSGFEIRTQEPDVLQVRRNSTASDGDKLMGPKSKGLLSFVVERTSKKRDAWRHSHIMGCDALHLSFLIIFLRPQCASVSPWSFSHISDRDFPTEPWISCPK